MVLKGPDLVFSCLWVYRKNLKVQALRILEGVKRNESSDWL